MQKTNSFYRITIKCPIFDPGQLKLLDYDEMTEQKIKDDPIFDKKLKMNKEESLDLFYVMEFENKSKQKTLFMEVPIKDKFEIEDISNYPFFAFEHNFERELLGHFRYIKNKSRRFQFWLQMQEFLKTVGIDKTLHKIVLETAMEFEKQNYKTWMTDFESYFAK